MITSRFLVPAVLLTTLALGACGKQGSLDRPAPLFGRARSQYEAQRAAANRAKGEANTDQSATSQTNGDYSQAADGAKDPALRPLRSDPTLGRPNDPFGSGPGGSLPDPYADPNRTPR